MESNLATILGCDIGGANTKISLLRTTKGEVEEIRIASKYFPFWKRGEEGLVDLLSELRNEVAEDIEIDAIGLTMTAELSDFYETKRKGVDHILDQTERAFRATPIYVLDVDGGLNTVSEARKEPLKTASSNWAATGWMVARQMRNCLVIDVGSTTTDIIPVADGELAASGRNDLERLINGELIYTGALRTNVASIVERAPVRGRSARVSSEFFASTGDVHLVLGNIMRDEYTTETADGRGESRGEALARLARVVCADSELLSEGDVLEIASYIYKKQVEQIVDGIEQVLDSTSLQFVEEISAVVAGLGGKFLAERAARIAEIDHVFGLSGIVGFEASLEAPSAGVALMVANRIEGV